MIDDDQFREVVSAATKLTEPLFNPTQRRGRLTAGDARRSWDANSGVWDHHQGQGGDAIRRLITDDAVLAHVGDVAGLRVLDFGCGNGYLSRTLAEMGAHVVAQDQSAEMLRLARERSDDERHAIEFVQSSVTETSTVPDGSIDMVVSNFVLQDVENLHAALTEARRVMRVGGRLIVVITHPCFSSGPRAWISPVPDSPRAEEWGYLTDDYLGDATYWLEWDDFDPVPYYHRPMSSYVNSLGAADFTLVALDEPSPRLPAEPSGDASRDMDRMRRIPVACVLVGVAHSPLIEAERASTHA